MGSKEEAAAKAQAEVKALAEAKAKAEAEAAAAAAKQVAAEEEASKKGDEVDVYEEPDMTTGRSLETIDLDENPLAGTSVGDQVAEYLRLEQEAQEAYEQWPIWSKLAEVRSLDQLLAVWESCGPYQRLNVGRSIYASILTIFWAKGDYMVVYALLSPFFSFVLSASMENAS